MCPSRAAIVDCYVRLSEQIKIFMEIRVIVHGRLGSDRLLSGIIAVTPTRMQRCPSDDPMTNLLFLHIETDFHVRSFFRRVEHFAFPRRNNVHLPVFHVIYLYFNTL